jgi:hypothetical protein
MTTIRPAAPSGVRVLGISFGPHPRRPLLSAAYAFGCGHHRHQAPKQVAESSCNPRLFPE